MFSLFCQEIYIVAYSIMFSLFCLLFTIRNFVWLGTLWLGTLYLHRSTLAKTCASTGGLSFSKITCSILQSPSPRFCYFLSLKISVFFCCGEFFTPCQIWLPFLYHHTSFITTNSAWIFMYFFKTASSGSPQIPLSLRMLVLNPGL